MAEGGVKQRLLESRVVRWLVRIVFFGALIFALFVSRELYLWYLYFHGIAAWLGWLYVAVAAAAIFYFVILPVIRILLLPSFGEPETSSDPRAQQRALLRRARMVGLRKDEYRNRTPEEIERRLREVLEGRAGEVGKARDRYVVTAFVGTAVSQSAVMDLYIVLSCGFKVMLRTLKIYGGRTSTSDTLRLMRDIVISGAFGASEIAELSVSIPAQFGLKAGAKFPVANMVLESLADGLVNAYLVCRIAMIAENYCTVALVGEGRHWQPSMKATIGSTKSILAGSYDIIKEKLGPVMGTALSFLLKFGRKGEAETV